MRGIGTNEYIIHTPSICKAARSWRRWPVARVPRPIRPLSVQSAGCLPRSTIVRGCDADAPWQTPRTKGPRDSGDDTRDKFIQEMKERAARAFDSDGAEPH